MQTGQIEQAESILEPAAEAPEAVDPKPTKKQLSTDRLAKLKVARERASEVARQRREAKASADAPIVVVEQSDSDEEALTAPANSGVIFVRRKRPKAEKPEPAAPQYSPELQYLYASMFGPTRNTY